MEKDPCLEIAGLEGLEVMGGWEDGERSPAARWMGGWEDGRKVPRSGMSRETGRRKATHACGIEKPSFLRTWKVAERYPRFCSSLCAYLSRTP